MLATLRFREDADLQQKALDHIANQAHFLSAVHPAKDSQPGEQKYDFPVLTTGKGNLFYPIFTDLDELSKWTEEKDSGFVVLDFDSYAEMVAQDSRVQGLVVDPYGANFILDRDMVNYLQVQKKPSWANWPSSRCSSKGRCRSAAAHSGTVPHSTGAGHGGLYGYKRQHPPRLAASDGK